VVISFYYVQARIWWANVPERLVVYQVFGRGLLILLFAMKLQKEELQKSKKWRRYFKGITMRINMKIFSG
jgi:hypothetical protein